MISVQIYVFCVQMPSDVIDGPLKISDSFTSYCKIKYFFAGFHKQGQKPSS